KAREAAHLYHQIMAAHDIKLANGQELRAKLVRDSEIPTGQIQLEAGNWVELKDGGKEIVMKDAQTVVMTVPQFLNLNLEVYDAEEHCTCFQLATCDAIRKTNRKGTNNNGPSGNAKAEPPKFAEVNKKNVAEYMN